MTASINAINFFDKRDIFSCTYSCTSLIFIGAPTWQSESLRVLVGCLCKLLKNSFSFRFFFS